MTRRVDTPVSAAHICAAGHWATSYFAVAALLLAVAVFTVYSAEPLLIRSRSGQFVVRGVPVGQPIAFNAATTQVAYVRLDPAVVAVSLERIKQALLDELALGDGWRGSISVVVRPLRQENEPVVVTSLHHTDGWSYRIDMPELVDRDRFLTAAVNVLLMEIANRRAGERPAEMPPWLGPGLVALLRNSTLATFTLEPQTSIVTHGRRRDPMQQVREVLRARTPLTLDELNLPGEEQFRGGNEELYQCCAQLFVQELLRLRNGRACLQNMLFRLPEVWNWQTAFLNAFQGHFPRLLDADKWWSLVVVHFTGRDPFSIWPESETWSKLEEILVTRVDVRVNRAELPMTTAVSLQSLIADWEFSRQVPVLQQKLNQLHALRVRVVPDLLGPVDGYRRTLEDYLLQRSQGGTRSEAKQMPRSSAAKIVKDTLKRLDELDAQRTLLRKRPGVAQTNTPG